MTGPDLALRRLASITGTMSRLCTETRLPAVLDLPEGQKVVTCMVIGYPAVKYQRIVPRKALKAKTLVTIER